MNLIDRIIDDPSFFQWVFNPDDVENRVWADFIHENPEYEKEISEIKGKLIQIRIFDKKLEDKEKIEIARNILSKTIDASVPKKTRRISVFLKYAAVALLFFSIGIGITYWFVLDKNGNISDFSIHNLSQLSGPVLILPEGQSVDLVEKESKLDYSQGGKIVVNDNQVIHSDKKENKINQLVIPYGNRSTIKLSDNTIVHLNAGSRLVYPTVFTGSKREVLLFGEAFFEVAKNEDIPFIVKTSDLSIKVLGTKFDVCAYPEDNIIQTVLTEGKVSLRRNDARLFEDDIVIQPDQMARYNKINQKTNIHTVDVSYYTLWKDGLIKFSNEDLSRIIKQLERFYNVQFSYEDPLLGSIKISGKLNLKKEKEEVFEYISRVALINIEKDKGNRYIIK